MSEPRSVPVNKVFVHPVILFNIVDNFERRNDNNKRVIGTLLGRLVTYSSLGLQAHLIFFYKLNLIHVQNFSPFE